MSSGGGYILSPDKLMNPQTPVYTEKSRCQDCYKCVRNCPVKAITIEKGSARVEEELCIYCGTCVLVCPQGAKTVRYDVPKVQEMLKAGTAVYAALAPSYVSEFPDNTAAEIIAACRALGFAGVSETALGAQQVSLGIARHLQETRGEILLSSACPVIVEYVKKYVPEQGDNIAEMLSPAMAQAALLKGTYGNDSAVIFIGPCIAKKREADQFPELLAGAITFREFRFWLEQEGIDLSGQEGGEEDRFIPEKAREGVLYAVDGGMTAGIKRDCSVFDASCMSFSGIDHVSDALAGLTSPGKDRNLFLELLACRGGCINGPGASTQTGTVRKRLAVLSRAEIPEKVPSGNASVKLPVQRNFDAISQQVFTPEEIKGALESVGKYSPADELDCSGCGYDSCRDFAAALLSAKAERTMCVSYMRRIAEKESNKLLAAMPNAAVILDADLHIIDCNRRFAALLGTEIEEIFAEGISLEGVRLEKYLPFTDLFGKVLAANEGISDYDITLGEAVLNITIFPIEAHTVVGGIIQDVTEPAVQKDRVIARAREVIRKNLSTAQQIASLLGENAADSETILNSIIKTFKTPHDEEK